MNKLTTVGKVIYRSLGDFFANPDIAALCQANSVTAAISTYFGGNYQQEQFETLTTFVHLLHSRLKSVEESSIDKEFLESVDGKRILGKVFRSITRDNRVEKLTTMANLTVNLFQKSKLGLDEKEVYVDILDSMNVLQLSILQRAVLEVRNRTTNPHKGFGWEKLQAEYESKGITKALLLQSTRALESNGLVNLNTATLKEQDQTHFISAFGEQFYDFITSSEPRDNTYL